MAGLQGSLKDFDITDILQLIHMNKKDGCLEIKTDEDEGRIFFEGGLVKHSETSDRSGENAVQRILMWSDGTFHFLPDKKSSKKTIDLPIQHLMLEAARKIDEWKQIERIIPSLDMIVNIVEDPETGTENIKLTSEEWKILTFVDGVSTIKEMAEKVNQSEFQTAKVFVGLVSSGLVSLIEKEKPPVEEIMEEVIENSPEEEPTEDDSDKKKGFKRFFSR